jgi:hypothetical protein
MVVKLFDSFNIDNLQWPQTSSADAAKNFLIPIIKNGTSFYFNNIKTTMSALQIDDIVLPVTINRADYNNSYVCSPYGHYVGYCHDQLSGKSKKILSPLIDAYGSLFKASKINQVVMVNNWLYSTNLYPKLSTKQIQQIKDFLIQKYPSHTLIFRSINDAQLPELTQILKDEKFKLIPSRIIYLTRADDEKAFKSRMFKSDLTTLSKSEYEISSLNREDSQRVAELYRMLNIDKYSKLNPEFKAEFIQLAIDNQLLSFKGLKKNNRLDAVVGFYTRDHMMTSPLFGYDTKQRGCHHVIPCIDMIRNFLVI